MPQRGNLFVEIVWREIFLPQRGNLLNERDMSDTYTQLYIQLVFAVRGRNNFIQHAWEEELYKYITAVIQNDKHKMIAINGMPDHIHIFLGLNPTFAISDVVKDIKRASNNCPPDRTGRDQWETFYKGKIWMAEWVWSIFLRKITDWSGVQIHSKSESTSFKEFI